MFTPTEGWRWGEGNIIKGGLLSYIVFHFINLYYLSHCISNPTTIYIANTYLLVSIMTQVLAFPIEDYLN